MSGAASDLPADVVALLDDHVEDLEALEVLLFLRRYEGQALTCSFVAEHLRRERGVVTRIVDRWQQTGLVVADPSVPDAFRLHPRDPAALGAIDTLARIYASDPMQVVMQIAERAMNRIRESARAFAASFRIRGKKE